MCSLFRGGTLFFGNSLPHPDKGLEMGGWQTNPPTDLLTLENICTEKDYF